MSLYFPVVQGEALDLRQGVEGLLTHEPDAVTCRINELEQRLIHAGLRPTFGMEIEYSFFCNPNAGGQASVIDEDLLYKEIVCELQPWSSKDYPKGTIIEPGTDVIMVNTPDNGSYCQHGGISELRTVPAPPMGAVERYWRTIDAIGEVAERHGLFAMIASTHVNFAAMNRSGKFLQFNKSVGPQHIAATQYNLDALRSLQIDSGLINDIDVQEAFPSKQASTETHQERIELRHGQVGVVDPRVDMLAVLYGLEEAVQQRVPARAARPRNCRYINIGGPLSALCGVVVFDEESGRLVAPASLDRSATWEGLDTGVNWLVGRMTGGKVKDYLADGGLAFRGIIAAIKVRQDGRLSVDPTSFYAQTLKPLVTDTRLFLGYHRHIRTEPSIRLDSPEAHLAARKKIARSPIARRIFGSAFRSLVSAEESVAQREKLIERHMIVSELDD